MYSFHYDTMLRTYKNTHLCFTDTASLLYEVKTNNIYVDILTEYHKYDFSDYPINHPNYSAKYKKAIGKFKNELNSMCLEEFI